jgi:hypothetical protein
MTEIWGLRHDHFSLTPRPGSAAPAPSGIDQVLGVVENLQSLLAPVLTAATVVAAPGVGAPLVIAEKVIPALEALVPALEQALPIFSSILHPAAASATPSAQPTNPILAELQTLESFVGNLQAMNSPAQQRILSFVSSLFGAPSA